MLYLIQSGNYLKIGYSDNENTFRRRLIDYNCHNPNYQVLELIEGTRDDEYQLHQICKQYQYYTEWFYYCKEVMDIWDQYTKRFKRYESHRTIIPPLFNVADNYEKIREEVHSIYKDGDIVNRKELKSNLTYLSKKYGVPIIKKATDIELYGFKLKSISLKDDGKYSGSYAMLSILKK